MAERGRCMDNIFIEGLWRTLKQEAVYPEEIANALVKADHLWVEKAT
jgi:hypothetical protein